MDVDKSRKQRRDDLWGALVRTLEHWKDSPFDMDAAYGVAATLGAYRKMGGAKTLKIPRPVNLAETALETLRKADFPTQYETLERSLAGKEEPIAQNDAIAFLKQRSEAQFAYLAIRDEIIPLGAKDLPFHRSLHSAVAQIVEREDAFFDANAWVFFQALDWVAAEREILGPEARFDFTWLWAIAETAKESWDLPLPFSTSDTQEAVDQNIDFRFVTWAFGEAFDPPIEDATRAQVLDRLSHTLPAQQRLAAKAETPLEMGSDLMERLVKQVGVFRILPKGHLPGFFVRLKRDRSIELIFRDGQGTTLSDFDGAKVEMGDSTISVHDGSAIVSYDDLVSLYDDMANLDERLVIILSDGTRETRFFPE